MTLTPAGPHACPFVALAEDRDVRSDRPDQAHRCYAEDRPEPRSLAHQRTYCLTREYAVCPVFLEWAGRLAAHKVEPVELPFPDDRLAGEEAYGWSASRGGASTAERRAASGVAAVLPALTGGRQLGTRSRVPAAFDRSDRGELGSRGLADPDEIEEIDESGRIVDRERLAVGPGRRAQRGAAISLPMLSQVQRDALGTRARTITERARIFGDRARNFGGRRVGPTWEPRRASDDYPDLRPPPRPLPAVPPMLLAVVALLVAAAVILILPGLLAGEEPPPSDRPAGAAPSASASATQRPREASPEPTERPRNAARTYRIKPGDTLRSIADRFGLTTAQLLRANPKITNPDRIRVGDRIRIPARGGAAEETARPSPSG